MSAEGTGQEIAEFYKTVGADAKAFVKALGKMPQVYSHRNGESEPPTVQGWYWYLVPSVHSSIVYYNGLDPKSGQLGSVWYGPIPCPDYRVKAVKP